MLAELLPFMAALTALAVALTGLLKALRAGKAAAAAHDLAVSAVAPQVDHDEPPQPR